MTNIIIKALEKLAALFLALAVLFLAVFGMELTSYALHIPSWVVWLIMAVIAVLWAIVDSVSNWDHIGATEIGGLKNETDRCG